MDILNTVSLESNTQIKINFDGGDLSSDAGLLLFKEFLFKIGAVKLIDRMFKTNDTARFRIHKNNTNLLQVICLIISACFEDDCADEPTNLFNWFRRLALAASMRKQRIDTIRLKLLKIRAKGLLPQGLLPCQQTLYFMYFKSPFRNI